MAKFASNDIKSQFISLQRNVMCIPSAQWFATLSEIAGFLKFWSTWTLKGQSPTSGLAWTFG